MKLWGKIWKENHMVRDIVVSVEKDDTRTHKIFQGLDEICRELDLGRPIWLEHGIRDFQRHKKVRFYQDSFIEEIDFDYLEFMILSE